MVVCVFGGLYAFKRVCISFLSYGFLLLQFVMFGYANE